METQQSGTTTSLRSDAIGIEAAVEQLTKDTRHREMRCLERRTDARLPFQRAVEVFVLRDDGKGFDFESRITGYTRDISRTGIGLLHDQPIHSSQVLLRFELLGGEMVELAVTLTWCHYMGDFWYSSGGRIVGATIGENRPSSEPSEKPRPL